MKIHVPTFNVLFGLIARLCILVAVWISFRGCLCQAQTTPLQLEDLTIKIPTNIPGVNRTLATNITHLNGWLNTNLLVLITATNTFPATFSNVTPFVLLQRLIQAYQTANIPAVQELYNPD